MVYKQIAKGNILASKCDTIVTTVNCVGIMGKGIAKTLRLLDSQQRLYPTYVFNYHSGEPDLGKLFLYSGLSNSRIWDKKTLLFPTKNHWRNDSKMEYLEMGLKNFVNRAQTIKNGRFILSEPGLKIKSIAFPLLGAGLGGLDKNKVLDLMYEYLSKIDTLDIEVYENFDNTASDGLIDILRERLLKIQIDENTVKIINDIITEKHKKNLEYLDREIIEYLKSNDKDYFSKISGIDKKKLMITQKQLELVRQVTQKEECYSVEKLSQIKGISDETVKKCFMICLDDELFERIEAKSVQGQLI